MAKNSIHKIASLSVVNSEGRKTPAKNITSWPKLAIRASIQLTKRSMRTSAVIMLRRVTVSDDITVWHVEPCKVKNWVGVNPQPLMPDV